MVKLVLPLLGVLFASTAHGQQLMVTFEVEVPHCTPQGVDINLRSNRLEPGVFIHDPLTRIDRTRFSGAFEIVTSLEEFEYKYSHGICDDTACIGIEKDLIFTGSGGELEPRKLAEGITSVSDLVFIWRDAVRVFDADGQPVGDRESSELVAFCGPYVSVSSETGDVTIGYDSYNADPVSLEYGPTTEYGERIDLPGSHRNHLRLKNLVPGQLYHYRISEGGVAQEDRTFTAPVSAGQPFRFGFLGDVQYYSEEDRMEAREVIAELLDFEPQLVVAVGDLVGSMEGDTGFMWPEMGRWNVFFGVAATLLERVPLVTAMGNHEEDCDYYWDVFDFPKSDFPRIDHFWFQFGNTHFTFLYTGKTEGYDVEGILESQTYWLQDALATADQDTSVRWKVVLLHRGPFSQGADHPDAGDPFFNGGNDTRPSWGELWEEFGVDLVLAGHNHNFTLALNNGVRYITSCSGAPIHELREPWLETTLYAERTCSAGLFDVGERILTFSAVRPDGSAIEEASFSLCREAADCQELSGSCPSTIEWSCENGECVYTCIDEPEPQDGGSEPDQYYDDGGPVDASGGEDVTETDDGAPDAGADEPAEDAGGDPGSDPGSDPDISREDCTCGGGGKTTSGIVLLLALLAFMLQRRKRQEETS